MQSKWKHFQRLGLSIFILSKDYNLIENEGVHYLSEADWPELVEINLCNLIDKISQQQNRRLSHIPPQKRKLAPTQIPDPQQKLHRQKY